MATFRSSLLALLVACAAPKPGPVPPLPRAAYAHYFEGKLAAYARDWPAATVALKAALAAAPDQPMIAVELAHAQVKAGDLPGAAATLAAARQTWPAHPQVWLASGDALSTTATEQAAAAYRRAMELQPDDERGYLGLAKMELARKRPDVAEEVLRVLVKHVPGSVDGHYLLAQRLATRDLTAAIGELRATIERNPDHIDARLDLARALRRTGKLPEAIAQIRSAFDRAAQPLDIAEELFYLLCEADDRTAAIDLLTLLDDDRSEVDALAAVARLERGLGRLDEARQVAERIAATDADAGAIALARTELAAHAHDKARAALAKIEPTSEHHGEAQKVAIQIELDAGAPAAALVLVGALPPKDPELALLAAFALADQGKPAEARALVPAQDFARARLEDRLGDTAAAIALCDRIIAAHPESGSALNLAGYLLADAGKRLDDATRYLTTARALAPGDPAVLDSWGWLLLKRGQAREAVKILDKAARYAPREPEILLHLATAWAADKAPRTAAELLARADGLAPPPAVKRRIDALRVTLPP